MKNYHDYHEFVIETIYHFKCSRCKGWWSHAVDTVYKQDQNKSCPHCGEEKKSRPTEWIRHEVDAERIYHFVCGECKNWWSHAVDKFPTSHMFCAHCGEKKPIAEKDIKG